MSHLPAEHDAEIRKYISTAEKLIRTIESGEENNITVMDNDFLSPTVGGEIVPFDHPRGELEYYKGIKEALEIGLRDGIIPAEYTDYIIRAPRIIRGLLEHDDPARLG